MDIGNSVYLVTDHKTTGAGVTAVICGLYERSARIAIEREEGTKTFDVPMWDLLPARAYTAAILPESNPIVLSAQAPKRMSNASFWSFLCLALVGVFSFKLKKRERRRRGFFLLLRLSYSFLILSSFLGDTFGQANPDISHDWLRYPRSQDVSLCWEVTYP